MTTMEPSDFSVMHDRQAITDLIYRYCRSMDRIDRELGYSIWHEDGTADYGSDLYMGNGRGFIDHVCKLHAQMLSLSHQITNILLELDGDRAASESYVIATLRLERADKLIQISIWARYIDQWSKRNGRWGIDHRQAIRDFDEIRPVVEIARYQTGKRDRSDPSYAALACPT